MNSASSKMHAPVANSLASLLLGRLALLLLVLGALWTAAEATSINIYKHRYPFYGGYGYGGPFYGGYGGGFGGGFGHHGGISIGGGGWGR